MGKRCADCRSYTGRCGTVLPCVYTAARKRNAKKQGEPTMECRLHTPNGFDAPYDCDARPCGGCRIVDPAPRERFASGGFISGPGITRERIETIHDTDGNPIWNVMVGPNWRDMRQEDPEAFKRLWLCNPIPDEPVKSATPPCRYCNDTGLANRHPCTCHAGLRFKR